MHDSWRNLSTMDQLNTIDQESKIKPVAIFKHSTRCGISTGAEYNLASGWAWTDEDLYLYHLDLLSHRDISNHIAERYGVHHQSPQLIWIVDGRALDSKTHHAINASVIDTWLQKA